MGVLDNLAALKGGYELGQAVFGQDEASRKQALMEKQLGLESALRVKQLEDEQAYRQGALANDWERNRIAEDQYQRANKLGWGQIAAQERGQDIHQNIANLQNLTAQRGQDITSRHYDTQAGLQQKELELRRLVADGTISYQQAQVELEREKNRISKQTADQMGGYYASMGRVNDARTAALDDELGRRRAFDKRRGNIFKALSDPAGPWAIPEGPERDEVLTALASGQPGALADIKMVGSAPAGGNATPEALAAAQRLTQSYVDRNVGAKDAEGNVVVPGGRLNSFQPFGDGSKDVMMMLEVRKRRPDGTEFTEVKPLTEGRTSVDQGGMPLRLKPQDIGMWAMGMKSLGEWGANNSEGQQYVDDMRAAYAESGDEEAFNKNLYQRQRTRAMESKQESRLKQIDEKALVSARQVAAQKAERILNQLAPQKANEEGGKVSPEDQQAMQTKLQIMKTIREDIMGRDLNDLHTRSVEQYFEVPAIKSQLERLNNGGTFAPAPDRGALQNPRAAGGQPSPLAQAAPDAGGILKSHLAAGKSAEHLTGLRGPFADRLAAMLRDAPGPVSIYSGYRSPQRQAQIFAGSDHSGHRVAHPGHSNHNHGVAADLKYASPAVRRWVHENAAKYGLAFRMPWEPWHIEPAGAGPDARNWGI